MARKKPPEPEKKSLAHHGRRPALSFRIKQRRRFGGFHMSINGVPAGGSGSFTAKANGALQAGAVPTWSSDDPLVSFTPAADGLSAKVAVDPSDTNTAFNLTVSGVNSAAQNIQTTVSVPILPAVPATGFDIEQTS